MVGSDEKWDSQNSFIPAGVPTNLTLRPPELPSFVTFAVSRPWDPFPSVDAREQALLSSRVTEARQASFARGRFAAHTALRALGLDHGPILRGEDREPIWPEGAIGSISHAAGFGVAIAAPTEETDGVGVDLEQLRFAPELWEQVPTTDERRWLARLDSDDRDAGILSLFSAKESIFKAFFPRVRSFFGFEKATLTPVAGGYVGRLASGIDREYPSDRSFRITCRWSSKIVVTSVVLPKNSTRPISSQ